MSENTEHIDRLLRRISSQEDVRQKLLRSTRARRSLRPYDVNDSIQVGLLEMTPGERAPRLIGSLVGRIIEPKKSLIFVQSAINVLPELSGERIALAVDFADEIDELNLDETTLQHHFAAGQGFAYSYERNMTPDGVAAERDIVHTPYTYGRLLVDKIAIIDLTIPAVDAEEY